MGRFSFWVLFVGAFLLQSGLIDAQRQRLRGQYGRRVNEDVFVSEAHPQPAVLDILPRTTLRPKVYELHHQIAPNLGDGSFKYYSASSDGLESEQFGHFNNRPYSQGSQVHQGSYTTKDEFGRVVKVDYVADKNGFQPIGPAGHPILPTPPPVPLEHLKAREDILNLQRKIALQHLGYHAAGHAAAAAAGVGR